MGSGGSLMQRRSGPPKEIKLAILGLDNVGKTFTAKGLTGESHATAAPTVGFSSYDLKFGKNKVVIYDLGGGKKIRGIWKNYFAEIHGVIYVYDSSDQDRYEESREAFQNVIEHDLVGGKPILVLANKMDIAPNTEEESIIQALDLNRLVDKYQCPCRLELCAANKGTGKKMDTAIKTGYNWLVSLILKEFNELDERVQEDVTKKLEIEAKEKKERLERVRIIREERAKKEAEERKLNGTPESDEEDEPDGDPFKRVDVSELKAKEERLKAQKKKDKEKKKSPRRSLREEESSDEDKKTQRSFPLKSSKPQVSRTLSDDEDGKGRSSSKNKNFKSTFNSGERVFMTDELLDYGSMTNHSKNTVPLSPIQHKSLYSNGNIDDSMPKSNRFGNHSPLSLRKNRANSMQDQIDSNGYDGEWRSGGQTKSRSDHFLATSLRKHDDEEDSEQSLSLNRRALGKKLEDPELSITPRRSLAPLTPLAPLESYDKKKKKKKKTKRNHIVPDEDEINELKSVSGLDRSPLPPPGIWSGEKSHSSYIKKGRDSRSPYLDPVEEPASSDDREESGRNYSMNEYSTSQYGRSRPNYEDDDIIT